MTFGCDPGEKAFYFCLPHNSFLLSHFENVTRSVSIHLLAKRWQIKWLSRERTHDIEKREYMWIKIIWLITAGFKGFSSSLVIHGKEHNYAWKVNYMCQITIWSFCISRTAFKRCCVFSCFFSWSLWHQLMKDLCCNKMCFFFLLDSCTIFNQ